MPTRPLTSSEELVIRFLEKAKSYQSDFELIKILRSRTYRIVRANVLIRASSEGNRRYFFGLNYLCAEEMANVDNPYIAFICGDVDRTVIIPAKVFFRYLPQISHDRNGEYKINIDKDLNIVLQGRGNRLDCSSYINNWEQLINPTPQPISDFSSVEQSLHSIIQGRLLEIGNARGFETFCPDKSKLFNERQLKEIATIDKCPELQFSQYDLLRQIDVLWFKKKGNHYIPQYAFEVELSTGVWSGVGRMSTLLDYENVPLYIISNDHRLYQKVISTNDNSSRYHFIDNNDLGDLYAAEKSLKELRYKIGL
ncbi:MAG: hypothetical protein IKQ37_11415 [Bacteroidaceae bacterium]|nr:hypothetical protein [Bacteroidaceae bacterium]